MSEIGKKKAFSVLLLYVPNPINLIALHLISRKILQILTLIGNFCKIRQDKTEILFQKESELIKD